MHETTKIIHAIPVDELTGAISVPIYQTSTFVQQAPGVHKGFDYARSNNPTRKVLEDLIAQLENGIAGFAFASGLAAIDCVLKLLKTGDEIVAVDDIYGGSFRLFTHVYEKFGIKVNYIDTTEIENVSDAVNEKTKLVWIESPTNPTLKISDIKTISEIAHRYNAWVVVDNTFASPASQKPIEFGADIIIHSATKYLAGHSDLIAGLVVVNSNALAEKIKFIQNASGGILAPFDSWLTIRGIETLPLRMEKISANAQIIAEYLEQDDLIEKVFYPGLTSHINYHIAKQQQKYFGGVISFILKEDTVEAATKFCTSTHLFKLAESLGGVKSLLCHPASMTHKSIPVEKRKQAGIADSLIRLSVGLEDADDLVDDIKNALVKINLKEFTAIGIN
ncbi:MAG: PLP-dependent transferase [Fimbriimonadaceae bacterium]|nr:PLP-dependent transferase [Chitinophagales bacterium]